MPVDLELSDSRIGGWHVLVIRGELDLHTAPGMGDRIAALMADGVDRIALDLTGVPFMDSSSLGVVVAALKRLREQGGELALVGVSGSPAKVLSITGMDRVIPTYDDADGLVRG
jgi:anti-sigma B factor antagonist